MHQRTTGGSNIPVETLLKTARTYGGTAAAAAAQQPTATKQLSMTTIAMAAQTSANKGGGTITKRLVLWSVLLVQICFIGCFWLLQLGLFNVNPMPGNEPAIGSGTSGSNGIKTLERVNFIKKAAAVTAVAAAAAKLQQPRKPIIDKLKKTEIQENVSNFAKDFYLKTNRLNATEAEMAMAARNAAENEQLEMTEKLWCFREGTSNETNSGLMEEIDWWNDMEQCKCLPDWHGKDCGQPEVIWRALMTAPKVLKLKQPSQSAAVHRLVAMLEGNFFSLDLLELQIEAIHEVVDYFIIYFTNTKAKLQEFKLLERKIGSLLVAGNYFIYKCSERQYKRPRRSSCTAAQAYDNFRSSNKKLLTQHLKPTDLFLYTNERVVLSRHALKFLKYYAAEMHLLRFRLKYNVYGFFWQHPERTHLSGLVSSLAQLDNPSIGNADPRQLLRSSKTLVIGDLNHYGGWYCEYCAQPDEIIADLQAAELKSSLRHVQFPNDTRNHHIDAAYLQKVIANGIYLDGHKQLLKMRHFSDKYYAPQYAEQFSWKFGNLLTNLYETLDEDIEDEFNGAYL